MKKNFSIISILAAFVLIFACTVMIPSKAEAQTVAEINKTDVSLGLFYGDEVTVTASNLAGNTAWIKCVSYYNVGYVFWLDYNNPTETWTWDDAGPIACFAVNGAGETNQISLNRLTITGKLNGQTVPVMGYAANPAFGQNVGSTPGRLELDGEASNYDATPRKAKFGNTVRVDEIKVFTPKQDLRDDKLLSFSVTAKIEYRISGNCMGFETESLTDVGTLTPNDPDSGYYVYVGGATDDSCSGSYTSGLISYGIDSVTGSIVVPSTTSGVDTTGFIRWTRGN